jgi:murein L,D-transpeptidase YcbB/YkuD
MATTIRERIDEGDALGMPLPAAERSDVRELYGPTSYAPLWIDASGRPSPAAREALTFLRESSNDGLEPARYHVDLLDRTAGDLLSASTTQASVAAAFDVMLSASTLQYFRHLHLGRVDPRSMGYQLNARREDHDFVALLRSAIARREFSVTASTLAPALIQYRALREALGRYRILAADSSLTIVPPAAGTVHQGDDYAGLEPLGRLLVAVGDLPADQPMPTSTRYEGALVDGVKRFQTRHGLEPDGLLGKQTQAALAVPLAWRAHQIELALERLRWLPDLDDRRLTGINIPMFRLWAWDSIPRDEAPAFGIDVIVGRALSQTPVFAAEMRELIFRPYWNVPPSILRREILPILKRDPAYLDREDMEIVRGQGDNAVAVEPTAENISRLERGALRLRQRPGSGNALGLVKFVFLNDENVYMHGTPAQALFAKSRRDFSHGCVRVEDPVRLAEWALAGQSEWNRARILSAMEGKDSLHVRLTQPIQVILFYTTAVVMPEDGDVHFAEDIYSHDARLDLALIKQ